MLGLWIDLEGYPRSFLCHGMAGPGGNALFFFLGGTVSTKGGRRVKENCCDADGALSVCIVSVPSVVGFSNNMCN